MAGSSPAMTNERAQKKSPGGEAGALICFAQSVR
jgi:hypothetical protein